MSLEDDADQEAKDVTRKGARPAKNKGCMTCRHKMRLDKEIFNRNLPILKTGDHIQMPLRNRCFGTFLKHHAIVKSFEVEDGTPKLYVIEVTVSKENRLKIVENEYDRELDQITLVEYRTREYNHLETYTRARELVQKDDGQDAGGRSYNVLTRNCEHFAAACVNGEQELTFDNFDKSTSLQSSKCFWVVFDILIAILQCAFFIMNFYIYAFYVHGKGMEQKFPQFLIHFFNVLQCYHAEQDDLGFMTDCEWKVLAFFEAMFLIFFLCIILPYQYLWLKRYKCVCDECLSARKIIFWVKAFLFAIFETGNKFLQRPLYDLIHCLKDNSAFTMTICIMISTIEAVFITWVASHLTKCFIFCVGNKHCLKWCCNVCKFKEDAYKYVVRNIHCHDLSLCLNDCFLCCGACIRPQSVPAEEQQPGSSTAAATVEQHPEPSTTTTTKEHHPGPSDTPATVEKQPRPIATTTAEEQHPGPSTTPATMEKQHPGPSTTPATVEKQPRPIATTTAEEQHPGPSTTPVAIEKQPRPSTTSLVGEQQPRPSTLSVVEEEPHRPRTSSTTVEKQHKPSTTSTVEEKDP